jgi:hypothetical protein
MYYKIEWKNKFGDPVHMEYVDEDYLYHVGEMLFNEGKSITINKM